MSFDSRFLRGADHVAAAVWYRCFAIAGRRRGGAKRKRYAGERRVLVVAPHPDDEVAGCAGTLLDHQTSGDRVAIAWVTDGRRSRAFGLAADEMAARRKVEAASVADALGVQDREWLGLREGEWEPATLAPHLRRLLASFAPHIVYAPSLIDFHPEHIRVAQTLASELPETCEVSVFPVHVPLTSLLANEVADVSHRLRDITAVFQLYQTQLSSLARLIRARRYCAAYHDAGAYAEEFWSMSADQYRRLHALGTTLVGFRGLRARALADPLAYLRGRALRRILEVRVSGVGNAGRGALDAD
jgi:LmbE family N-acetylglucosaminyl deacetylase